MITILLLTIISLLVFGAGLFLLSIGGTFFIVIFADIIVAMGILWAIFYGLSRKKKK